MFHKGPKHTSTYSPLQTRGSLEVFENILPYILNYFPVKHPIMKEKGVFSH